MQIRTAILVAGTTLAILAPAASAGLPWEPTGQPAHTTFNAVDKHDGYRWSSVAPTTENSYGQSKSTGTVNGVKLPKTTAKAKAKATHVVTMIVEPMLPGSGVATAPDPNACASSMVDCTDQQLCELWGANCDAWAADVAAQVRAANEQQ